MVLVGLAPDRFRLRFDAAYGAEHGTGAVQHAQRTLHLDSEIHVAGRIDNIDTVLVELLAHALPETGRRRGRDGDTALLFLLHPVHDGRTVVHLADLVRYTGVEQDALGRRRLTGIDVGHDADIPIAL